MSGSPSTTDLAIHWGESQGPASHHSQSHNLRQQRDRQPNELREQEHGDTQRKLDTSSQEGLTSHKGCGEILQQQVMTCVKCCQPQKHIRHSVPRAVPGSWPHRLSQDMEFPGPQWDSGTNHIVHTTSLGTASFSHQSGRNPPKLRLPRPQARTNRPSGPRTGQQPASRVSSFPAQTGTRNLLGKGHGSRKAEKPHVSGSGLLSGQLYIHVLVPVLMPLTDHP